MVEPQEKEVDIELENWSIQVDFLILETELVDNRFRKKKLNHRCKDWYEHNKGRWFCPHLIAARHRNKELQKKWVLNFFENPMLKRSGLI